MRSSFPGFVRIIAGLWRSRRLQVLDHVRPSPDAVRETLFNWLMPVLSGAKCLDFFAGAGALSFEALSRGAAHVDMVDASPQVVAMLQKQIEVFKTSAAQVHPLSLPQDLKKLQVKQYDIVFIDAPFYKNLIAPCCEHLQTGQYLAPSAYVYLEMEKDNLHLNLPKNWLLWRHKETKQIRYCLYRVETLP